MLLVAFCQLVTVTPNETAYRRDLVQRQPACHRAVRKTVAKEADDFLPSQPGAIRL